MTLFGLNFTFGQNLSVPTSFTFVSQDRDSGIWVKMITSDPLRGSSVCVLFCLYYVVSFGSNLLVVLSPPVPIQRSSRP